MADGRGQARCAGLEGSACSQKFLWSQSFLGQIVAGSLTQMLVLDRPPRCSSEIFVMYLILLSSFLKRGTEQEMISVIVKPLANMWAIVTMCQALF